MKRLLLLLFTLTAFVALRGQAQESAYVTIRLTLTDRPAVDPEYISVRLLSDADGSVEQFNYNRSEDFYYASSVYAPSFPTPKIVISGYGIVDSDTILLDYATAVDGVLAQTVSMSSYQEVTFVPTEGFLSELVVSRTESSPAYTVYNEADGDKDTETPRGGRRTSAIPNDDGTATVYAQPGRYNYWGTRMRESDRTYFDDTRTRTFDVTDGGDNRVPLETSAEDFTIVTFNVKGIDGQPKRRVELGFGTLTHTTDESGTIRHAVLKGSPLTWRAVYPNDYETAETFAPLFGSVDNTGGEATVEVDFSQLAATVVRVTGLSNRGFDGVLVSYTEKEAYYGRYFQRQDDGSFTYTFYNPAGARVKGYTLVEVDNIEAPQRPFAFTAGEQAEVVLDYAGYAPVSFAMNGENISATVYAADDNPERSASITGKTQTAFLEKGDYKAVCNDYAEEYHNSVELTAAFTMDGNEKTVDFTGCLADYVVLTVNFVNNPALEDAELETDFTGEAMKTDFHTFLPNTDGMKLLMKKGVYDYYAKIYEYRSVVAPIKGQIDLTSAQTLTLDLTGQRFVKGIISSDNAEELRIVRFRLDEEPEFSSGTYFYEKKDFQLILPDGEHTLTIAAADHKLCKKTFTINAETEEIRFDLESDDRYPLEISVYDHDNSYGRVPNVSVTLEGIGTVTAADGQNFTGDIDAFMAVPEGSYNCTASAPGYRTKHGTITVNKEDLDWNSGIIRIVIDMTGQYTAIEQVTAPTGPAISFTRDAVNVTADGPVVLRLYDTAGRLVAQTADASLPTTDLPAGVYIATATGKAGTARLKLIVRK